MNFFDAAIAEAKRVDPHRDHILDRMKSEGGCQPGCRLLVLQDITKLAIVVRHLAPGATKPDDKEIEMVVALQSGYAQEQEIVHWLRGLHGEAAKAEKAAEDGRAEGFDYRWFDVC